MPIGLLKDMIPSVPRGASLLGMDVGNKTIGFAVAGPDLTLATPIGTLRRTKFMSDMKYVTRLIRDYEIGGFVIGYPLNMDGSEGPRCQSVRNFAEEMERYLISSPPYPPASGGEAKQGGGVHWIALFDERLSTFAAQQTADDFSNMNKRQAKDRGVTDQLAAMHILQSALDFFDRQHNPVPE
jgi:putative Holliday junction resolvase